MLARGENWASDSDIETEGVWAEVSETEGPKFETLAGFTQGLESIKVGVLGQTGLGEEIHSASKFYCVEILNTAKFSHWTSNAGRGAVALWVRSVHPPSGR